MYEASHGDGPRFPVINRRVTPTEANDFLNRTDRIPAVYDAKYDVAYIRLYERQVTTVSGGGMTVINETSGDVHSPTLTWPPGVNEYYSSPYQQRIYFNKDYVGNTFRVTYNAVGTIVDAVDINYLFQLASFVKNVSPKVSLDAGANLILEGKLVLKVLEYNSVDDCYKVGSEKLEIRLFEIDDISQFRTEILNISGQAVEFKYMWTYVFIPER